MRESERKLSILSMSVQNGKFPRNSILNTSTHRSEQTDNPTISFQFVSFTFALSGSMKTVAITIVKEC